MRRFNVFAPEFSYDDSRPAGYKAGSVRLSPEIGASRMVATVYELPPDTETPRGRGRARVGRRRLLPGKARRRAHVHHRADETARLMITSTFARPAVAVFPDSNKLGVWPNADEPTIVRREPLDYWDGES